MKSKVKSKKQDTASTLDRRLQGRRRALVIALGILVLAFIAYWVLKQNPANQNQSTLESTASNSEGFPGRALIGRWIRPDGGYVLEIKSINADGKVEAAYFNPRPIHVEQAKASKSDQATRVFIELRDTGYPGSTYTLVYDPGEDQLKGIYYQAAMQQNFDIVFVRMK